MARRSGLLRLLLPLVGVAALAACAGGANDEVARAALKAADIAEINNVMSMHSWYHAAMQNGVEVEKIWSKRDDIVIARNTGYWKGANVRKYYGEKVGEPFTTGAFVWHPVTTGVIEVAGDRQTAKGVWYTPGAGGHASADGRKSLDWMWEKYGVDFIREDGHWKVWHMKVYTDWSGDANLNFQKGGMGAPPGGGGDAQPSGAPPAGAPQGNGPPPGAGAGMPPPVSGAARKDVEKMVMQSGLPAGVQMPASLSAAEDVVYANGYKEWSETAAPRLQPRPPEPYRTFSETWSYVDENE
ncbi:MAG: nuclear transport factor 2 family protein [Steroidobacteraceae bacterium]